MTAVETLLSAIETNDDSYTVADFGGVDLKKEEFLALINSIAKNTSIKYLSLLETYMEEEYIKPLRDSILQNATLTTLKIQKFGDYHPDTIQYIEDMLSHVNNNLKVNKKITP